MKKLLTRILTLSLVSGLFLFSSSVVQSVKKSISDKQDNTSQNQLVLKHAKSFEMGNLLAQHGSHSSHSSHASHDSHSSHSSHYSVS